MEVRLDENMPAELARLLVASGRDASTVIDERLGGSDDRTILKEATAEVRVLMKLARGRGRTWASQTPERSMDGRN